MRSCRILIISTAVAFGPMSAYGSTECRSIEGVESLLAPGKVVLLGEIHGTAECPAFTEALACHAARAGLEVVVGLELLAGATEEFERYLASEGKPADRTALLAGSLWQQSYQDGRTSRAMADLLEGLGRIRRAGHSVRVTLFDAQPGDSQARERAMARNLASSVFASPEALHVVLTGNRHSRITPGNGRSIDYEPMGHLLSRAIGAERLISLPA